MVTSIDLVLKMAIEGVKQESKMDRYSFLEPDSGNCVKHRSSGGKAVARKTMWEMNTLIYFIAVCRWRHREHFREKNNGCEECRV
jgi:hypothetical protein